MACKIREKIHFIAVASYTYAFHNFHSFKVFV